MNTYSSMGEQEKLMIRNQLHSSFPIIQSVIEGVQQGQIFKSAHQDYWILHKAGFSEVFLHADDGIALVDFINENHDLPKYFHIYNPPEKLTYVFRSRTEVFNVRERDRVQLTYKEQQKECNSRYLSEDEFTFTEVTQDNFDSLEVFNLDLANKFWNGKKEFVTKGLGVFLKDKKDNPVSLCYAAAIAGEKAEIDVITNEQYRGKGLAKRIVTLFIDRCLEKNLTTSWDCFPENIASLNTAIGLNFTEKKSYNFLSIYRK